MFFQSEGTPSSLCSMYAAISLRMHSTPELALYDPVTETHALALIKRLLQQNTEYGSTVSQLPENCMICNNRGLWMLSNRYTVNWVLYIMALTSLNNTSSEEQTHTPRLCPPQPCRIRCALHFASSGKLGLSISSGNVQRATTCTNEHTQIKHTLICLQSVSAIWKV